MSKKLIWSYIEIKCIDPNSWYIGILVTDMLPAAMQNGPWSNQQYGPHKARTISNLNTFSGFKGIDYSDCSLQKFDVQCCMLTTVLYRTRCLPYLWFWYASYMIKHLCPSRFRIISNPTPSPWMIDIAHSSKILCQPTTLVSHTSRL